MVTRKNSMPYPTSSPPPVPTNTNMSQSHLIVDSADVPPIPTSLRTSSRTSPRPDYQDMGNPWDDAFPAPAQPQKTLPDVLRPGIPGPLSVQNPSHSVPEALRPGRGENTPGSSADEDRDESPEREWWDDDDEDDKNKTKSAQDRPGIMSPIKRKPVGGNIESQQVAQHQAALHSNNPYRRPSETHFTVPSDQPDWGSHQRDHQFDPPPHPLRSHPSSDAFSKLNLADRPPQQFSPDPPDLVIAPPVPSQPPPPPPGSGLSTLQEPLIPQPTGNSENPWLSQSSLAPNPSPIPLDPSKQHLSHSTDDLFTRDTRDADHGKMSLQDELHTLPNAVPHASSSDAETSLLADEEPGPPLPIRPSRQENEDMYAPPPGPPPGHAPTKPPRPAVVTNVLSDAEIAQMTEQRNETYSIKHFDWFDQRSSRMRRSSMLTQNKNGPCPLLALVNALILGATEDMQAALDDALRRREQVTLGLIIETLMDELITRSVGSQLPDVDELNRFLMRLRTGMNANPRYVPNREQAPNLMDADSPVIPQGQHDRSRAGTFEMTQDIKLYGSFGIQLLHGWLPRPHDEACAAFSRTAQTYEDAQAILFNEEELEYKLSRSGLSSDEQRVWEDITSIKQFLQAFPTQLTPFGLSVIHESLRPGEFAILFRNDHFSTIYKHPRDERLYSLITDAGYADRDEIIWESLEDISGAQTQFFSGDFKPNAPETQTRRRSSQHLTVDSFQTAPLSPQEQQEQHDADFAMALQLQEEEEQRERQRRAQATNNQQGPGNGPQGGRSPQPISNRQDNNRRSTSGNIPIPLRSTSSLNPNTGELRPAMPPRNTNRNPAVNRPADVGADDAPPAYEEAATQRPYVPPVGSPLHPATSNSTSSVNPVHVQGQTTGVTSSGRQDNSNFQPRFIGQQQRRSSAYGENSGYHAGGQGHDWNSDTFGPGYAFMSPGGVSARERRRQEALASGRPVDNDRECTVM